VRTDYQPENQAFTDRAHVVAQSAIYPHLFPQKRTRPDWLSFESTSLAMGERERLLDGEMATDRIVSVHGFAFAAPMRFYVQERFRRPKYLTRQDITITEWNHASNRPSELYKLSGSGIFVYGYFDEATGTFLDWYALNTAELLRELLSGSLRHVGGIPNPKRQDFLAISFDALNRSSCVIASMTTTTRATGREAGA